jgi:hypothetical protein
MLQKHKGGELKATIIPHLEMAFILTSLSKIYCHCHDVPLHTLKWGSLYSFSWWPAF